LLIGEQLFEGLLLGCGAREHQRQLLKILICRDLGDLICRNGPGGVVLGEGRDEAGIDRLCYEIWDSGGGCGEAVEGASKEQEEPEVA
jgi:hypothetical protein